MIQVDGIFVQQGGGGPVGPKYKYTGLSKLKTTQVGDEITWEILFITSGILTPLENLVVDIFIAGAGGGAVAGILGQKYGAGGGGGYVKNLTKITLSANAQYEIIIGAGGISINVATATATAGGKSSIKIGDTIHEALGGSPAQYLPDGRTRAGDGGSGGAGSGGNPGIDGGDGTSGVPQQSIPGKGSGESTRAYGDGELYCSGGGCSSVKDLGIENSGNGGWAHESDAITTNGSDGIVAIRLHKEAA